MLSSSSLRSYGRGAGGTESAHGMYVYDLAGVLGVLGVHGGVLCGDTQPSANLQGTGKTLVMASNKGHTGH